MRTKKLRLLSLLCLCVLLLSGCHGAKDSTAFTLPETFDTSREYKITFWAKNDSNATQHSIYKQAIADFEALYPNIHVTLRPYTDYGRIYGDVITNISTGTTPNVCITYPDHIATYLTGVNTVVPLDTLMTDPRYGLGGSELKFDGPTQEEIIPKFLSECVVNGAYYALPYMRSTEACYINKTYVEKLGYTLPETLTWDFVWEVSRAAMQKDEEGNYLVNDQKVLIPFIYKSTDNMMIQMLRQQNAGYSSAEGEVRIFNDVTRSLLLNIADHALMGAFSTFKISSYPANYLNAGQCIFAIDSTAGATWMGADAPQLDIAEEALVEFETAVMTIPQFDPAQPQMISQGPSLCIFNKEDPQEVLASWLFMQFMLTDSVQLAYSGTEGYAPVTTSALASPDYQAYLSRGGEDNEHHYAVKIQATKLLLDNVENTFVTPVFNGSASLRDASGQLIEEVVKGIRGKKTVDDAFIDNLYVTMNTKYHLDEIELNRTGKKADLGPLPATSSALIAAFAVTWALIFLYLGWQAVKKAKKSK